MSAMVTEQTNSAAVTAYIQKTEPVLSEMIEAIRKIILATDKQIAEQIKWNSPSFFYTGEMELFDPQEYKRDILVINLHKGFPLLVFPTGAKVKDSTGLLEGDYKDGRRLIKFTNIKEIKARKKELQKIIKDWLALIEK
jgi:hypothetical protein